jgi:hypothetical protein
MWEDEARPTAAVMSSDIEGRNDEECPGGSTRLSSTQRDTVDRKGFSGGSCKGLCASSLSE